MRPGVDSRSSNCLQLLRQQCHPASALLQLFSDFVFSVLGHNLQLVNPPHLHSFNHILLHGCIQFLSTLLPKNGHFLLSPVFREGLESRPDLFPDDKAVELSLKLSSQQEEARELSVQAVHLKKKKYSKKNGKW